MTRLVGTPDEIASPFSVAAAAALIGTSNVFELAVAMAIGLFGLTSTAGMGIVVGGLIQVLVMLQLVAFANRTRQWCATHAAV